MDSPSISVVIPTHNRSGHVGNAIVSACTQTLQPREVIVVNNGSTDGTRAVLEALQREHRLLLVHHQENRGEAGSRNTGVRLARGDLVAFLDDDDTWVPEKLERQAALFHDPGLDMAFTSYRYVAPEGERVTRVEQWSPEPRAVVERLVVSCCIQTSTIMVRRGALADAGPFDGKLLFSDWPMWLRIAGRGCRVGYLDEPLTIYNWHGENISRPQVDVSETALRMFDALFADPALDLGGEGVRRRSMARWHFIHAFNLLDANRRRSSRRHFERAALMRPFAVRPGWLTAYVRSFLGPRAVGH